MTQRAIGVNEDTVDLIAKLNEGVRPSQEYIDVPSFFIFSDDEPDTHGRLMFMTEFKMLYRFADNNAGNTIEEI